MKSLAIVAAALADGGGRRQNAMTVLKGPPAVRIVIATLSVAIARVVAERGVVDGNGHFLNNQSTQQQSSQRLMSMGKHDSIC